MCFWPFKKKEKFKHIKHPKHRLLSKEDKMLLNKTELKEEDKKFRKEEKKLAKTLIRKPKLRMALVKKKK